MNFQTIPPIETNKQLLDLAFGKARLRSTEQKLSGNWLQIIRKKETLKLDIIQDALCSRLNQYLKYFPHTNDLSNFYLKLMHLTLDYPLYKQSLGAMNWAIQKIRFFQREFASKITKETGKDKIYELSKQFYGRISSVIKQIDSNLKYLEECRKIMRTYPDVKDMPTVCIYGFPNVGKTTVLNLLTGTKAKVAAYAFTTKSINAGYVVIEDKKIQVLDVPGTLARKDKMNLIELQAELVLEELANLVIFVFDFSGSVNIKEQEDLYKKIKKSEKKVLIYLSKKDLLSPEQLKAVDYPYYSLEELKAEVQVHFSKIELQSSKLEPNLSE